MQKDVRHHGWISSRMSSWRGASSLLSIRLNWSVKYMKCLKQVFR